MGQKISGIDQVDPAAIVVTCYVHSLNTTRTHATNSHALNPYSHNATYAYATNPNPNSRAPGRAAAGVALQAGAVAHQGEVRAFGAAFAHIALHPRFRALVGHGVAEGRGAGGGGGGLPIEGGEVAMQLRH